MAARRPSARPCTQCSLTRFVGLENMVLVEKRFLLDKKFGVCLPPTPKNGFRIVGNFEGFAWYGFFYKHVPFSFPAFVARFFAFCDPVERYEQLLSERFHSNSNVLVLASLKPWQTLSKFRLFSLKTSIIQCTGDALLFDASDLLCKLFAPPQNTSALCRNLNK